MEQVSVFRRGNYFWMSFIDPKSGKRRTTSTGLRHDEPRNAKAALELARKRSQDAIALKPILDISRWSQWAPLALKQRYGQPSQQKTLVRYERCYRALERWFAEKGILGPAQIGPNSAAEYVAWRETNHPRRSGKFAKRNTALLELKCLSVLLEKARKLGFVDVNHVHRHGITKGDVEEKPEITDDEAIVIRQELAKRGVQWMVDCFEVGMLQGCRLSETAMPLSWIDTTRRVITFRIKGGRIKATALHPGLIPLVRRRRSERATKLVNLPSMASKDWWLFFREIVKPHLCFHCSRVTAITKMARAGVPQAVAMAYVLHSSSLVHKIYQRLGVADLGSAVAAIKAPRLLPRT